MQIAAGLTQGTGWNLIAIHAAGLLGSRQLAGNLATSRLATVDHVVQIVRRLGPRDPSERGGEVPIALATHVLWEAVWYSTSLLSVDVSTRVRLLAEGKYYE